MMLMRYFEIFHTEQQQQQHQEQQFIQIEARGDAETQVLVHPALLADVVLWG